MVPLHSLAPRYLDSTVVAIADLKPTDWTCDIWSDVPLIPARSRLPLMCDAKFYRGSASPEPACTGAAAEISLPNRVGGLRTFTNTELRTGVRAGGCFHSMRLKSSCKQYSRELGKPEWVLYFSAFFQPIRIFGGPPAAITWATSLLPTRKLHPNLWGLPSVMALDTDQNINAMAAGLYAKSSAWTNAGARAGCY